MNILDAWNIVAKCIANELLSVDGQDRDQLVEAYNIVCKKVKKASRDEPYVICWRMRGKNNGSLQRRQ